VLDHLVVNQLGDYLSINSEFDMTLDKSLVLETATSWAEIKEENEKTTPTNQEKFQILSRRKDYLKREKLNLELEAISYLDTSKVDSEIKKIDEVINGFLSKVQKEHIIEFLKTQGEGEHIRSEESNSYWNDIYYGGVPLTVKMVESDYYMNVYKAWGNFLIEEFKNGNIS
uniref:hypothetical protein n=1 Tax=Campylobacter concisus TaxID=199 RepID=UPI0015E15D48